MTMLSLRRHIRGLGLSPRRREAAAAAPPPTVIQDGLIAEWRFDEGAGQTLTDSTGNGHHGRLGSTTGADAADPTWTAQGLSFDGGDFVECDNAGISGGVARTVLAVVKTGNASGVPTFSMEWSGPPDSFRRWTLRNAASTSNVRLEVQGAGYTTAFVVPVDTWIFVGATQSGSNLNTAIVYLNGSSENVMASATLDTAGNFWWGRANNAPFPMAAAYGLVYNRALSPAEVEQNRQVLAAILAGRGITLP